MKQLTNLILGVILTSLISCNLNSDSEKPILEKVTINNITVPKGFVVTKLYEPTDHEQGSWVSIAKDDEGNLYTSDQYGSLYKTSIIKRNQANDTVNVQKLDLNIGLAQGLLWHNNVLFALVNSNDKKIKSGLYKITDSDKDGELDLVIQMKAVDGEGEHGPHNIVLSPDQKSMYLVFGNHTDIPDDINSLVPEVWDEDNLLPVIKDPSGHANSRKAPGGWVAKTDLNGENWTIVTVGTRNTYDLAFNRDGELFGFDSDMEYDLGMPWYRPIRLNHMTSGADFGWRTGTGKFRDFYPDNLGGIANLGQGSPTGLLDGKGLAFPSYYQKGLFLFDWSYGTMYHAKLVQEGSSYTAEITEFLSGVPLPLTNGVLGDDGALYFLIGGRRLESGLFQVKYEGELNAEVQNLEEDSKGKKQRELRKKLEELHGYPSKEKLSFIFKNLDHQDRVIRFSARIALEHLDYQLWKDEINKKNSDVKTIALGLSIARHGNDNSRLEVLEKLLEIEWQELEEPKKMDFIRSIDLLMLRMDGDLNLKIKQGIENTFLPAYLKESSMVNKELCKILSFLQVAEIIEPTLHAMETETSTDDMKAIYLSNEVSQRSEQYGKDVENMLANMPNERHVSFAYSLSFNKNGWTTDTRERYFKWFGNALQKSGGKMYVKFIRAIQKTALANVPLAEQDYLFELTEIAAAKKVDYMKDVKQPQGPGINWTVELLMSAYEANYKNANFENGENMFKASLCISCHSINGNGGTSGPELTKIGSRFSVGAIGEAIINPSGTIGDRYQYSNYHMKNGTVVTGLEVDKTETDIKLSTSAFSEEITSNVKIKHVVKVEESPISPMPAGLVNRLNEQEITDLIAYLLAGGNKENMK